MYCDREPFHFKRLCSAVDWLHKENFDIAADMKRIKRSLDHILCTLYCGELSEFIYKLLNILQLILAINCFIRKYQFHAHVHYMYVGAN